MAVEESGNMRNSLEWPAFFPCAFAAAGRKAGAREAGAANATAARQHQALA
jgi:hypothetical protein